MSDLNSPAACIATAGRFLATAREQGGALDASINAVDFAWRACGKVASAACMAFRSGKPAIDLRAFYDSLVPTVADLRAAGKASDEQLANIGALLAELERGLEAIDLRAGRVN